MLLFGPRIGYNDAGIEPINATRLSLGALSYLRPRCVVSVEPKAIRLSPTAKFIAVTVIVCLLILLIWAAQSVMAPFIAAAITAYLFNPLIGWLNRRTRIGRALWILVLYVLVGALIYALVRTIGPLLAAQYGDMVAQLPR